MIDNRYEQLNKRNLKSDKQMQFYERIYKINLLRTESN